MLLQRCSDCFLHELAIDLAGIRAGTRIGDGGADSLNLVELVMELVEEYDLDIAEEAAAGIVTVGDLIRLLLSRRSGS